MKLEFKIDHMHEFGTLIAAIDKHRVGACILLVALLGLPVIVGGAFMLLR